MENKNYILNNINKELDKLIDYILNKEEKKVKISNKKEYKMENNNELNIFTFKDIQEENKEIKKNLENKAYNYMNYK